LSSHFSINGVGVAVGVGVLVGCGVGVAVGVAVGVLVGVLVGVAVAVGSGVALGVGVGAGTQADKARLISKNTISSLLPQTIEEANQYHQCDKDREAGRYY
jgi:hypothetical protein